MNKNKPIATVISLDNLLTCSSVPKLNAPDFIVLVLCLSAEKFIVEGGGSVWLNPIDQTDNEYSTPGLQCQYAQSCTQGL